MMDCMAAFSCKVRLYAGFYDSLQSHSKVKYRTEARFMMDFMIAFSCIERSTIELKLGFMMDCMIALSCIVRLTIELRLDL